MINLLCILSLFKIVYWVARVTMRFHIAQTRFFLGTKCFRIYLVPVNDLVPLKYCPGGGVQGSSN